MNAAPITDATDVPCPACGARPGTPCVLKGTKRIRPYTHDARLLEYLHRGGKVL